MQIIKTLNQTDLNNKCCQIAWRYSGCQALVWSEYRLHLSVIPYDVPVSLCWFGLQTGFRSDLCKGWWLKLEQYNPSSIFNTIPSWWEISSTHQKVVCCWAWSVQFSKRASDLYQPPEKCLPLAGLNPGSLTHSANRKGDEIISVKLG